jgi:hypothetical protein
MLIQGFRMVFFIPVSFNVLLIPYSKKEDRVCSYLHHLGRLHKYLNSGDKGFDILSLEIWKESQIMYLKFLSFPINSITSYFIILQL